MATPKKGTPPPKKGGGNSRKQKQPTQKTPMQRVKILGANGKFRWEWRPW